MGENLSILSAGRRREEFKSYMEARNNLLGVKEVKDERTAEQIIQDTFRKHGLTIKGADES